MSSTSAVGHSHNSPAISRNDFKESSIIVKITKVAISIIALSAPFVLFSPVIAGGISAAFLLLILTLTYRNKIFLRNISNIDPASRESTRDNPAQPQSYARIPVESTGRSAPRPAPSVSGVSSARSFARPTTDSVNYASHTSSSPRISVGDRSRSSASSSASFSSPPTSSIASIPSADSSASSSVRIPVGDRSRSSASSSASFSSPPTSSIASIPSADSSAYPISDRYACGNRPRN